jgi:hypothetical protein
MPKNPDIIRPVSLHTTIPEDVWIKMTLYLYSDIEGRVPKGAYREFLTGLIREFFDGKENPSA